MTTPIELTDEMRELAQRFAKVVDDEREEVRDDSELASPARDLLEWDLDATEREALLGWVRRRMVALSEGLDHPDPKQYLAERIGDELELDSGQTHAEYLDLCWTLCELAEEWA